MSDRRPDPGEPTRPPAAEEGPEPALDQPGLAELREAVETGLRRGLPRRATVAQDGIAGLSVAVANVPDGMANGLLVGVSPIHGLYATMLGPLVGGIVSSSQLMVISTTAAASLTSSQSLASVPDSARAEALFVLAALVGVFLTAFGLLGFARLTNFVSYSVLTGFLAGISILLVLSQLPTVTGYGAVGGNKVSQALDVVRHAGDLDPASVAIAAATLVLALLLPRTRLGSFGRLLAIAVPSVVVAVGGLEGVRIVRDVGEIPQSVPTLEVPSVLRYGPALVTGALAVAVVVLVQGVGVSRNAPNPGNAPASLGRDLVAQGLANVASGLFRGLPVGGSLSATALGVLAGARMRWTSTSPALPWPPSCSAFRGSSRWWRCRRSARSSSWQASAASSRGSSGPCCGPDGPRSSRPSPRSWRRSSCRSRPPWRGAWALSALLYVSESSTDVSVVELVEREDGRLQERSPPRRLPSERATTLDVYGHLFYAGARTLERLLPEAHGTERPVVVLRLRGRRDLGATLIDVLARYADEAIMAAGGRFYLSGVGPHAYDQIVRTGKLRLTGPVRAYEVTPILGESTREARADAEAWLVGRDDDRS